MAKQKYKLFVQLKLPKTNSLQNHKYVYLNHLLNKQLKKWGVKYDEVIFGKTQYDLLIDDKARNIDQIKTLKQILKFIR